MPGYEKKPPPSTLRILVYCFIALAVIVACGWYQTHIRGDHTQYDGDSGSSVSNAAQVS